jgi:hypothetical protein
MSYREDNNFRRKILINDTERELPQDIFSEAIEVDWPALRGVSDSVYCLRDSFFKVACCN